MERRTEFNVNLAINRYISQVNASNALSREDEDELMDHLLSEIETLEKSGLSTEEAFLISEKRLGQSDIISKEYRKANPWSRILHLMTSAILFLLGYKMIFNLIKVFSLSTIMTLSQLTSLDILTHMEWLDLWLQIVCLIGLLSLAILFMKKFEGKSLKFFWFLPLLYLGTEGALRLVYFMARGRNILELSFVGIHHMNHAYVYFTCVILAIVGSMWFMLQNRSLRGRLA